MFTYLYINDFSSILICEGVLIKILRVTFIVVQTVRLNRNYRRIKHRVEEQSGKRLITKVRVWFQQKEMKIKQY